MRFFVLVGGAILCLGVALTVGFMASYLQPYMMYIFDNTLIATLTSYMFGILFIGLTAGIIADKQS